MCIKLYGLFRVRESINRPVHGHTRVHKKRITRLLISQRKCTNDSKAEGISRKRERKIVYFLIYNDCIYIISFNAQAMRWW